jgi:hypothetical protein
MTEHTLGTYDLGHIIEALHIAAEHHEENDYDDDEIAQTYLDQAKDMRALAELIAKAKSATLTLKAVNT